MSDSDDVHGLPTNPYHPLAWLIGDPIIGSDVWIGAFCVVDGSGGLTIGKGSDVSAGAHIYSHSTVGRCISERGRDTERHAVEIGEYVHIGANAVILMGTRIGHHSIVGAGAVVLEGTIAPPYSALVGVPARIIEGGARRYAQPQG